MKEKKFEDMLSELETLVKKLENGDTIEIHLLRHIKKQ